MPAFNRERLEGLVLFIAHKTRDNKSFGRTKLAKVLFYADFDAFRDEGEPLTGATYEHREFGPFPRELYDVEQALAAERKVRLDYDVSEGEPRRIIPLTDEPPDLSALFEPWQLRFVELKIQEISEFGTARNVSRVSHDHPGWKVTGEREEIPYGMHFLSQEPRTPGHADEARWLARERGWLTDEGWVWERNSG